MKQLSFSPLLTNILYGTLVGIHVERLKYYLQLNLMLKQIQLLSLNHQ